MTDKAATTNDNTNGSAHKLAAHSPVDMSNPADARIAMPTKAAAPAGTVPPLELFDGAQPLSKPTIQVTANALHTAILKGDQSAVSRILTPLLSSDRQELEQVYGSEFGKPGQSNVLQADLQSHLSQTNFLRDQSILTASDGVTNNAGQISVALSELNGGYKNADVEIREVLQTLNSAQIAQLETDFSSQNNGENLTSAITSDAKVSAATKAALPLLLKGSDLRTSADDIQLANLAVQYKDVNLLGEALRGDIPAASAARNQLQNDADFQASFQQAFKNNPIAKDFLTDGQISLSTIADANNAGFFGGQNSSNLELALKSATPAEQQEYVLGRQLSDSKTAPTNQSQQQALQFYNNLHAALVNFAAKSSSAPWVGQSAPDGNVVLAQLAGVSPSDLKNYASDPALQQKIFSNIGHLNDNNKALANDLLTQLKNGNLGALDPVDKVLNDKATGADPYQTELDIEAALKDPTLKQKLWVASGEGLQGEGIVDWEAERLARNQPNLFTDNGLSPAEIQLKNEIQSNAYELATKSRIPSLDPEGLQQDIENQIFHNGGLALQTKAMLGFPYSVVSGAPGDQNVPAITGVNQNQVNQKVAGWEDDIITGGSVVSSILASKGNANTILSDVEGLSQRDWQLLSATNSGAQFKADIDNALNLVTSDQGLKSQVDQLLQQKSEAPDYQASEQIKRSILDSDPKSLINNILTMRTDEAASYQSDPAFRAQLDKLVNGLSGEQQSVAQALLSQVAETGRDPDVTKLSPLNKVLFDDVSGVSPYQKLQDIQTLLADPTERNKFWEADGKGQLGSGQDIELLRLSEHDPNLGNEAILSPQEQQVQNIIYNTVGDITNKAPAEYVGDPGAEQQRLTTILLQSGKFLLTDEIRLGFPKVQIYEGLATASAADKKSALQYLSENPADLQIAKYAQSQNGQLDLADRLRSYVVDGQANYSDFQNDLAALTPTQLQSLKQEYAQKYGSDLDNDFLNKVGGTNKDFQTYEHLLTPAPTDGLQDYYNNLEAAAHSESGYSPDGSQLTLDRSNELFAENLQQYQSKYESLPPDKQAQLDSLFGQALQSYQQSKQDFADKLSAFVETAAALGIGIASGGTLAPELFATLLVASAAGKVAIDKEIEGNDFNGSLGSVLSQAAQGGSQFTAQFIAPALLGGGAAITDAALEDAVVSTAEGQALAPASRSALSQGLSELSSSGDLNQQSIDDLLAKVAPTETAAQRQAVAESVTTQLAPLQEQLQESALSAASQADQQGDRALSDQLLQYAASFGKGAAGGAAVSAGSTLFVSAFNKDGIDPKSLLESALFGAAIGGTATVVFKGLTDSQDVIANIKKDGDGNVVIDPADNPQGLSIRHADGTVEQLSKTTVLQPGDQLLPTSQVDAVTVQLLEIRSQVSGPFFNQLVEATNNLSPGVRELLDRQGTQILTGGKVTDILPELAGQMPGGHPPGSTWDNVEGLFSSQANAAVVSEYFDALGTDSTLAGMRVDGVLRHEIGHAVDSALGNASAKAPFRSAWQSDVSKIPPSVQEQLNYYIQPNSQYPNAGPAEAFAEAYAIVSGGGADNPQLQALFQQYFPDVLSQVKSQIDSLPTTSTP